MKHLLLFILAFAAFAHAETLNEKGPPVTEIVVDQASADIFPKSWRGGKINASAKPLLDEQVIRFRSIAERALAKYPPALLHATLRKLHGLGQLEYSGVQTGGTRSESAIYIVCKPHYRDAAVERIIHAEYSSLLFMKSARKFDAKAWLAQNAEGTRYLGSGVAAVKAGKTSAQMKPELNEQGFLSEYAQASMEEDFNSHVVRLFMGEQTYWQALERYPRLRAKAELVVAFYTKLDARFSRASFARLRTLAAQAATTASPGKPDASK